MSLELDTKKLSFMVFPTRFPEPVYLKEYQQAYQCWRSVWNQALKEEMNVMDDLYSDNFSRQSLVAVLFYDNQPASLVTLNYCDLNDPVSLDDSYFKVWPELAMRKVKKEGSKILISGNLTVNFNFRRKAYGVCWKKLIFSFLVRYLKSSPFDAVLGTPRLERSVEKACYQTGAHSIHKDLPYTIEGQRIDLISWHRNLNVAIIDPEIWSLVNYVWNNSTKIFRTDSAIYNEQGEKNVA